MEHTQGQRQVSFEQRGDRAVQKTVQNDPKKCAQETALPPRNALDGQPSRLRPAVEEPFGRKEEKEDGNQARKNGPGIFRGAGKRHVANRPEGIEKRIERVPTGTVKDIRKGESGCD